MASLRTVWIVLLASTGVYAVLLSMNSSMPALPEGSFTWMLGAIALSLGVVSQAIGKRMHARAVEAIDERAIEIDEEPDPNAPGANFREAGPLRRRARDPRAARRNAETIYMQPMVVSCGLADSVAVMGLALGLVGGPRPVAFGLIALGALLLAALVPTDDRVYGPVEERLGLRMR